MVEVLHLRDMWNLLTHFLPMLTKKELRTVAIDRADVKTVPSTTILAICEDGPEVGRVSLRDFQNSLQFP